MHATTTFTTSTLTSKSLNAAPSWHGFESAKDLYWTEYFIYMYISPKSEAYAPPSCNNTNNINIHIDLYECTPSWNGIASAKDFYRVECF